MESSDAMTTPRQKPIGPARLAFKEADIDAFVAQLEHPLKQEILAVQKTILGADAGIRAGVK